MVEKEEAAIASQKHGKHVPVATDIDTIIEDMVFSEWPVPMLYMRTTWTSQPVGG
jgi:hypothetical protein